MLMLYRAFGILYLISGIWCATQIEIAASFLGFTLAVPAGFAEFLSVYGGLQIGLGVAMLMSSFQSRYVEASLYFSAIFSSSLTLFRLLSFAIYGVVDDFIIMLAIEVIISIGLWWAWFKRKSLG